MRENEPGQPPVRLFVDTGEDAPREDLPFIERHAVVAIVRNPKTGKYLALRWKEVGWEALVTGGIEEGQTPLEAAQAEILQETGYKHVRFVRELAPVDAKFYHRAKKENRWAHFQPLVFELLDDEQVAVDSAEATRHEPVWLDSEELTNFQLPEVQRFLIDQVR